MRLTPRRPEPHAPQVLAACALLLEYPDDGLRAATSGIDVAVDRLPDVPEVQALRRFVAWWSAQDPVALADHYVARFDLQKRCSMYLTFYEEGDKRGRGMALLRLRKLYRTAGLPMESHELPDYLPVMLEFAATAPDGRGLAVLAEHRAALEVLRLALTDDGTPYAGLLDAVLLVLGEPTPMERVRAATIAAHGPPQELVGLEPFGAPEVTSGTEARR
jgi:nitrate reductase delta subunit